MEPRLPPRKEQRVKSRNGGEVPIWLCRACAVRARVSRVSRGLHSLCVTLGERAVTGGLTSACRRDRLRRMAGGMAGGSVRGFGWHSGLIARSCLARAVVAALEKALKDGVLRSSRHKPILRHPPPSPDRRVFRSSLHKSISRHPPPSPDRRVLRSSRHKPVSRHPPPSPDRRVLRSSQPKPISTSRDTHHRPRIGASCEVAIISTQAHLETPTTVSGSTRLSIISTQDHLEIAAASSGSADLTIVTMVQLSQDDTHSNHLDTAPSEDAHRHLAIRRSFDHP